MTVEKPTSSPSIAPVRLQSLDGNPIKSKNFFGRTIHKLGEVIKRFVSPENKVEDQSKKSLKGYVLKSASRSNSLDNKQKLDIIKSAATEIENATCADRVQDVFTQNIHSTDDLCMLSRQLPDATFNRMKGAFFNQLRTLEAKHHADYMLDDCRDSKGVLDSGKLARTLAQHQEFISKNSDNMFFTDGANYVKARLTMIGTPACELLCRIRGCTAEEFRLPSAAILDSGASSMLKEARLLGGNELREARKKAAAMVDKELLESNAELRKHLVFQFMAATDICRNMEQMLLENLEPSDYDELCTQMVSLRADSCMDDIMLKVQDFNQLSQRLKALCSKFNATQSSSLVGEKKLRQDGITLGRVAMGGQEVPGLLRILSEDKLNAELNRLLANKLSNKIEDMAEKEGISDGDVRNAIHMVNALCPSPDV